MTPFLFRILHTEVIRKIPNTVKYPKHSDYGNPHRWGFPEGEEHLFAVSSIHVRAPVVITGSQPDSVANGVDTSVFQV